MNIGKGLAGLVLGASVFANPGCGGDLSPDERAIITLLGASAPHMKDPRVGASTSIATQATLRHDDALKSKSDTVVNFNGSNRTYEDSRMSFGARGTNAEGRGEWENIFENDGVIHIGGTFYRDDVYNKWIHLSLIDRETGKVLWSDRKYLQRGWGNGYGYDLEEEQKKPGKYLARWERGYYGKRGFLGEVEFEIVDEK
jgi:hypothetical protein